MGKRINTLNTASSPANDDYLPIDGATNGTRKISADFVNNLITDVEVDGTSVVTSGVAEIDLSGKQDTLTAGSNIQIAQDGTISATDTTYTAGTNVQIDNGVISATDTTYTAGTGIDITNGVISSNVTPGSTVSVTQKTSTGTNIADITVDGVTTQLYAPNGGGGGSTVIPNPTGTPTDTLDTVSIDGTIYEIQGSGGGNSWTDLTAVLEAGETSLTIIDSHITINGTYEFYTSKYGLNPLSVVIDDPTAIVLLQPLVTQESELIVTATASTNWSGFEPWKAFADSAVNSGWIASGGSGGYWLQAEFPYEVNISSIDFKSLDSNRSHAISRVSYSNDGNTFTDATLTSSTMQNNIGHADVSMSETAKYIRLCFDYSLDTQTYPMVSQLELYGNIDSSSAGSMTLTFEEQAENINVKVRVS